MDRRLGQVRGVLGADDDVAELTRAGGVSGAVDRERQHVGGPVEPPVGAIELLDPSRVDELDGEMPVDDPRRVQRGHRRRAELPGHVPEVHAHFGPGPSRSANSP